MTYISNIDGKWYAFGGNSITNQVYSIGKDNPERGRYFARWTKAGIKYVASPSPTRSAAYKKAKRNGNYGGEY